MIKVFISYKSNDFGNSRIVKQAIEKNHDFKAYLDRIDDALLKDGPGLASHLLKRIDQCDQLLAVVGPTTAGSWWVPWEIGVGSEKHYFLATYLHGQVELPSYLKKWPILRSMADIDKYCELSRRKTRDRSVVFAREHSAFERETVSARIAANFHTELRRALGQIPY